MVSTNMLKPLPNNPNIVQKPSNNLYVREIRARIDAYFKLVLREVRDSIPKSIGFFLVKSCQEKL